MSQHLPDDLLWDEARADGQRHASDLVITALADGESAIVPGAARAHVEACAHCTHRMGAAALLSMGASRAIVELGPLMRVTPVSATLVARRRLPIPMLVAALVIAALGAAPTLMDLPGRAAGVSLVLMHALPTLSRGSAHLLRNGLGPLGVAVTCASALLLVMAGLAVTRLLPKPVAR